MPHYGITIARQIPVDPRPRMSFVAVSSGTQSIYFASSSPSIVFRASGQVQLFPTDNCPELRQRTHTKIRPVNALEALGRSRRAPNHAMPPSRATKPVPCSLPPALPTACRHPVAHRRVVEQFYRPWLVFRHAAFGAGRHERVTNANVGKTCRIDITSWLPRRGHMN